MANQFREDDDWTELVSIRSIQLINIISSSAVDQPEATVGVFLDLSKAFNTLDHQILFTKLEHYGIRDVALQWIKSYFSCRRQVVQINQTRSSTQTIKCGVPRQTLTFCVTFRNFPCLILACLLCYSRLM